MLSGSEIYKREVYELNNVLDSFRLGSNNLSIRHSIFGSELFDFLNKNALLAGIGKYCRPDFNKNPHRQAIISTYLFKTHYEESNLAVMDYWNHLHPNDRKYCREIANKMNSTRNEWETEINESEKYANMDNLIPF
jgi:hypothetical protein